VLQALSSHFRRAAAVGGVATAILFATTVGQAAAATYPAGPSTFTGSAEGWVVKEAACNVPLLCTASGTYDGTAGNPPGSIAANSNIALTLLSLFSAKVTYESPTFAVTKGGSSTLQLERSFTPGGLLALAPTVNYSVSLLDKTAGTQTKVITEALSETVPFGGISGAVSTVAGHSYAISITAVTSSSVVGTGLLAGNTSARFDNVGLTVGAEGETGAEGEPGPEGPPGAAGEKGASGSNGTNGTNGSTGPAGPAGPAGADGKNGSNGKDGSNGTNGSNGKDGGNEGNGGALTTAALTEMTKSSLTGTATEKGGRVYVAAKCPTKVGAPCKISVQGLLTKTKVATSLRTARVGQGKAKQFVLQVRPAARAEVAKLTKLKFKVTMKVGTTKASVYKTLTLTRR
jgi:Collagen triple helix repeat (20 copies)